MMLRRSPRACPLHGTATALLLVVSTLVQTGVAQGFNCYGVCFSEYIFAFDRDCELLTYVIGCYNEHREDCEGLEPWFDQAENSHSIMGCPDPRPVPEEEVMTTEVTTAEPATTVPPPPPPPCPKVPSYPPREPIPSMKSAEIFPTFANRDCVVYEPEELQHCSLFGFSTLRAFRSYRGGLETCNIPGSWYLLRHRTVTVEVEGVASGEGFDHTRLSKVNVTFFRSGNCLEETKSYVASLNSALSQNFTDQTSTNNSASNLQLSVDPDGELVTILATWINTTIVIRRHTDLLSVTLQVPGHLGFESDGLCRGCPVHAYLNTTRFNNRMTASDCIDESNDATVNCFLNGEVSNIPEFHDIFNSTYSDVCIYSLWRRNSTNNNILSFIRAVSSDARSLPDRGFVPARPYPNIVDPVDPGDPADSTTATDSYDPADTTTATDSYDPADSTDTAHIVTRETVDSDRFSSATSLSHGHQRTTITTLLVAILCTLSVMRSIAILR